MKPPETRDSGPERVDQYGAGQATAYPPHDCHNVMGRHWHNQFDANWLSCGTCGRILAFRYKSLRRRLIGLFCGDAVTPR